MSYPIKHSLAHIRLATFGIENLINQALILGPCYSYDQFNAELPVSLGHDSFFCQLHANLSLYLEAYQPGYCYSEHIDLFWRACFSVGLLKLGSDGNNVEATHPLMADDFFNLGYQLRRYLTDFNPRQMYDKRYEAKQKREKLSLKIQRALQKYSRTLVIRTDLAIKPECWEQVDLQFFLAAKNELIRQFQQRMGAFAGSFFLVWGIEQGIDKGYHIHLSVLYNGHNCREDWYYSEMIGKLWEQITGGVGCYHNCHSAEAKNYFAARGKLGIGMIQRKDQTACENAVYVMCYPTDPTKDDQYLRMFLAKGRSLGTCGVIKSAALLEEEDAMGIEESSLLDDFASWL